ncbi:hypothetical protein BDZ89DRAFT_732551 [Hymenopellis radicata]|nr:hypothetical protein BDZ89DRAFT_732551 [Hymenopellis radicata]
MAARCPKILSWGRACSRWFETRRRDWAAHTLFPWATGARVFFGTRVCVVSTRRPSSDANTLQQNKWRMHNTAEESAPRSIPNESESNLITRWQGTWVLRKSKQYRRKRRKHHDRPVGPMNGDRKDRRRDRAKCTVPIRMGFCNAR